MLDNSQVESGSPVGVCAARTAHAASKQRASRMTSCRETVAGVSTGTSWKLWEPPGTGCFRAPLRLWQEEPDLGQVTGTGGFIRGVCLSRVLCASNSPETAPFIAVSSETERADRSPAAASSEIRSRSGAWAVLRAAKAARGRGRSRLHHSPSDRRAGSGGSTRPRDPSWPCVGHVGRGTPDRADTSGTRSRRRRGRWWLRGTPGRSGGCRWIRLAMKTLVCLA